MTPLRTAFRLHARCCGRALAVAAVLSGLCVAAGDLGRPLDLAPLMRMQPAPDGSRQWRALGPLFERSVFETAGQWTVEHALPRPLFTAFRTEDGLTDGCDILWPLGFGRERQGERVHFLLGYLRTQSTAPDAPDDVVTERRWLLPVIFTGYNQAEGSYAAVFPLGGTIRDIIGFDTVRFVAFPLFVSTRKGQVESASYVWPVVSMTRGPEIRKWRVFPLYGVSQAPRTTQRFILWPFVHLVSVPERNGVSGGGFFVLPFYGRTTLHADDGRVADSSWTVLWPLFYGRQSKGERRLNAPWPFVQIADGEDMLGSKRRRVFWPFYGSTVRDRSRYVFAAWPVIHRWEESRSSGDARTQTTLIAPILYTHSHRIEGEVRGRSLRLWPLVRYERQDDAARLRAPALWPLRETRVIARNYAPFWQLYTMDSHAERTRHEILWGLISYETDGQATRLTANPLLDVERTATGGTISLLKGLLTISDGETEHSGNRLLWFLRW